MTANRWTEKQANDWYDTHSWLVGANYVPAYACNQIEMWREETFDPKRIDLELGWAEKLGMNTMRVFLHDLLWEEDPQGLLARMDLFLEIADKHGIKIMFVLFDSVWNPEVKMGPQPEPTKGVHNSGWVQGPGKAVLENPAPHMKRLQSYVEGIISTFRNDPRVLVWDVWNEPDNKNGASYGALEPANKVELVAPLLDKVFQWARNCKPAQPLTCGLWIDEWDDIEKVNAVQRIQLQQSDVMSFHNYGTPDDFERRAKYTLLHKRPLLCTEYMARKLGSTFQAVLPVAKKMNIGMMNWGFVKGRTQTHLPWDSWQTPYTKKEPVWFHEILHEDGTPYIQEEVDFIKEMTSVKKPNSSKTKPKKNAP